MFTGIIQEVGRVLSLERRGNSARITIGSKLVRSGLSIGDSVAINGVCLTCEALARDRFIAYLLSQTMAVTNLGSLKEGAKVNLEPAVVAGQPLGGHIVYGHIDDVLTVLDLKLRTDKGEAILSCNLPREYKAFVLKAGSIALNGVSLTVSEVYEDRFTVSLIPYTLSHTNLGSLKKGDKVNVEFDQLLKSAYYTVKTLIEKMKGTFNGNAN